MAAAGDIEELQVEGWSHPAFLHPEAKLPRNIDASALLSPFDPVVWERDRADRLFGFRYRIEIYVPKPKRIYGYYVLPFLMGDRLVARIDLKSDRKAGVLRVLGSFHEEDVDPAEVAARLGPELIGMSDWLGLSGVDIAANGNLAGSLRSLA